MAAFYFIRRSEGAFINHSHNGDNLTALALIGVVFWCVIGLASVCVGWVLRVGAEHLRRGPSGPDEVPSKH
jgi:hypothetical protein